MSRSPGSAPTAPRTTEPPDGEAAAPDSRASTARPFPFSDVGTIWMNGSLVPFDQAQVHVLAHGLHYASGVFEGLRAYRTPRGTAVFRLEDHLVRLEESAGVLGIEIPFERSTLRTGLLQVLAANRIEAGYVRPLVVRGFRDTMFLDPRRSDPEVVIAAWPTRTPYLGAGTGAEGVDVGVSSWRRPPADVLPANVKATANYLSSQLIHLEATGQGYADGIALDLQGNVTEGSAMNLFLVRDGELWTPPLSAAVLAGITRDSILTLAAELGIRCREEMIPRGYLYTAREAFFTGTAAEVTPIRSIDRRPVGEGRPGPLTRRLARAFAEVTAGQVDDSHGWLTLVDLDEGAEAWGIA